MGTEGIEVEVKRNGGNGLVGGIAIFDDLRSVQGLGIGITLASIQYAATRLERAFPSGKFTAITCPQAEEASSKGNTNSARALQGGHAAF